MRKTIRLNLGCGQNKMKGYVNADKYAACAPDVVCDLETFPWPWPDNAASGVALIHVLEHLGRDTDTFLGVMKELYRVCADKAEIQVHVPHPRHDDFIGDPTHVRVVTPELFNLFDRALNLEWKKDGYSNTPLALYTDTDFHVTQVEILLDPQWQARVDRGEITWPQVDQACRSNINVAREYRITLRVRK